MLPWGPRVPVGGRGARALLPAPRSSLSSGTMDTISEVVQRARAAFNAGKTRPLQCRVQQLEGLRRLIDPDVTQVPDPTAAEDHPPGQAADPSPCS